MIMTTNGTDELDDLDEISEFHSGSFLESSPRDVEIEWESNDSLRREQIRIYLKHQDELERDRLHEAAEADEQLFGLLQHYRYDDDEFLEKLDPELAREIAEREAAADYEASVASELSPSGEFSADHGAHESQGTESDCEPSHEGSGPAMNLESKLGILERLANLRRTGTITDMEFEALKLEALYPAAK